ncbi:Arginine/ornithine antiporter ArcD [hydrothermal vent metagenome]|uniref:Arginine/ornithine antiporter ArcD n=1 Tax=hydrothermal vent metagenome TaxID=652676 RepID=A0A1W1C613_9ZZZZ
MRLGLYIFAALTLSVIIGAFAYTINPNNYVVEIMGINFNFPVAVWLILPMLLLLAFTIVHMLFYSLKSYFKLKKWQRDAATLDDALYWSLVNEPKEQKYAITEIASSAALLGKSSLNVLDNVEGLSPRLAKVLNIINKIKNGEFIDLKEHKMAKVFNEGNPLLIQNRLNRLESDEKFVEEVMKSSSSYSDMVRGQALEIFARKETFFKARKYAKVFDVKNFMVMLERVNHEEEMGLTSEILNDFVSTLKLACSDFVKIADVTKKQFTPDENLALFKQYQTDNPKAQNAYLYLLFEYELLDAVAAYLEEHEESEFVKFRALYELKKEHKNYKLEDLIDTDSIC